MKYGKDKKLGWTILSYLISRGIHAGIAYPLAQLGTAGALANMTVELTSWCVIFVIYAMDNRDDSQSRKDGALEGAERWAIYFLPATGVTFTISFIAAVYDANVDAYFPYSIVLFNLCLLAIYFYRKRILVSHAA